MSDLISIGAAAEMLGVCPKTLRDWDKQRLLCPIRTPGGHRRYSILKINQIIEESRHARPKKRTDY